MARIKAGFNDVKLCLFIDPFDKAFSERVVADTALDMAYVPITLFTMRLTHQRRECGCYPDPQTSPEDSRSQFPGGDPHYAKVSHAIGPMEVQPFFIDEKAVSNADFKFFPDDTEYRPKHPENFLKHWPGLKMPDELADHPVVYIDLADSRAYAEWAEKACQKNPNGSWRLKAPMAGTGRGGHEFDPDRGNTLGQGTLPVDSYPHSRNPFGCYNMSGNVWEWTESYRDDGHTRSVMIRADNAI